jgi:hypothetical protein
VLTSPTGTGGGGGPRRKLGGYIIPLAANLKASDAFLVCIFACVIRAQEAGSVRISRQAGIS